MDVLQARRNAGSRQSSLDLGSEMRLTRAAGETHRTVAEPRGDAAQGHCGGHAYSSRHVLHLAPHPGRHHVPIVASEQLVGPVAGERDGIFGESTTFIALPPERAIDIDTPEDWHLAERQFAHWEQRR
jgi:hypothetical protein